MYRPSMHAPRTPSLLFRLLLQLPLIPLRFPFLSRVVRLISIGNRSVLRTQDELMALSSCRGVVKAVQGGETCK